MKSGFFSKNYSACWKFLNESRWYVVFAVGIFSLMFLVGFIYPMFFREQIFNFIEEIIKTLEGKSTIELIGFIFFNNLRASFMAIVLGVTLGIFPLIVGMTNGYLLGFVSREVATKEGLLVMWQLLPHGVFELPAIILSIGIGLKIGMSMFKNQKGKWEKLRYNLKEVLRFFVFVIFPLLLIAGIIEGILIGLI